MKRLIQIAGLALLAAVLTPALALGNTVVSYNSSQSRIIVDTTSDDANDIAITQQGNVYTISEVGDQANGAGNAINLSEAATECTKPVDDVVCTVANLSLLEVKLEKGDDYLDAQFDPNNPVITAMSVSVTDALLDDTDSIYTGGGNDTVDAGAGDDGVYGGTGNDTMQGGSGDDELIGEEGNDRLTGGTGDDVLEGDDGDDVYLASAGADGSDSMDDFGLDEDVDTADYSARSGAVTLSPNDEYNSGNAAADQSVALPDPDSLDEISSDIENLIGGSGNDNLTGSSGVNGINAGPGNDTVNTRDAVADTVDCGAQTDTLTSDALDVNIVGCESVDNGVVIQPPAASGAGVVGGGGVPVGDKTAPKVKISTRSAKMSKRGTVKVSIGCPASEPAGCSGTVALGGGAGASAAKALGKASFGGVAAGKSKAVAVKLTKSAKNKVKKRKKLKTTVIVTAKDTAGNVGTARGSLTIKK